MGISLFFYFSLMFKRLSPMLHCAGMPLHWRWVERVKAVARGKGGVICNLRAQGLDRLPRLRTSLIKSSIPI